MGDLLTRIAYGEHFFEHHGAKSIKNSFEAIELIAWAIPKFWLVDMISARKLFRWSLCPIQKKLVRYVPAWFPGANFRRIGNQGKHHADIMRYWAFEEVKAAMVRILNPRWFGPNIPLGQRNHRRIDRLQVLA